MPATKKTPTDPESSSPASKPTAISKQNDSELFTIYKYLYGILIGIKEGWLEFTGTTGNRLRSVSVISVHTSSPSQQNTIRASGQGPHPNTARPSRFKSQLNLIPELPEGPEYKNYMIVAWLEENVWAPNAKLKAEEQVEKQERKEVPIPPFCRCLNHPRASCSAYRAFVKFFSRPPYNEPWAKEIYNQLPRSPVASTDGDNSSNCEVDLDGSGPPLDESRLESLFASRTNSSNMVEPEPSTIQSSKKVVKGRTRHRIIRKVVTIPVRVKTTGQSSPTNRVSKEASKESTGQNDTDNLSDSSRETVITDWLASEAPTSMETARHQEITPLVEPEQRTAEHVPLESTTEVESPEATVSDLEHDSETLSAENAAAALGEIQPIRSQSLRQAAQNTRLFHLRRLAFGPSAASGSATRKPPPPPQLDGPAEEDNTHWHTHRPHHHHAHHANPVDPRDYTSQANHADQPNHTHHTHHGHHRNHGQTAKHMSFADELPTNASKFRNHTEEIKDERQPEVTPMSPLVLNPIHPTHMIVVEQVQVNEARMGQPNDGDLSHPIKVHHELRRRVVALPERERPKDPRVRVVSREYYEREPSRHERRQQIPPPEPSINIPLIEQPQRPKQPRPPTWSPPPSIPEPQIMKKILRIIAKLACALGITVGVTGGFGYAYSQWANSVREGLRLGVDWLRNALGLA